MYQCRRECARTECTMTELCNTGVLLIRIECKRCCLVFFLCRSCYRGHVYCSDQCRKCSSQKAHRIAQHKYRTSEKGRKANRLAARRRRIKIKRKNVADRGSTPDVKGGTMPPFFLPGKIVCLFCQATGIVVTRFPRRAYRPVSSTWRYNSNPNHQRHHEYGKSIGAQPNSPDP